MFFGSLEGTNYQAISTFGAVLNPAIALGLVFGSLVNGGSLRALWSLLIYPVMPLAGAVVALLFFEYVYKKTQSTIEGNGQT